MSITIAPCYVQTHTELLDVVQNAKKMPNDKVKQGLGVLAAQVTSPTSDQTIGDEVKDLSLRVVALGRTFALANSLIPVQDAESHRIAELLEKFTTLHQVMIPAFLTPDACD